MALAFGGLRLVETWVFSSGSGYPAPGVSFHRPGTGSRAVDDGDRALNQHEAECGTAESRSATMFYLRVAGVTTPRRPECWDPPARAGADLGRHEGGRVLRVLSISKIDFETDRTEVPRRDDSSQR